MWIRLLISFFLACAATAFAEPQSFNEAPKPDHSESPAISSEASKTDPEKVLTRQDALIQGLTAAKLPTPALDHLARVFEPVGRLTPEQFAKQLDTFPLTELNQKQKAKLIELFSVELGGVKTATQGKEFSRAAKKAAVAAAAAKPEPKKVVDTSPFAGLKATAQPQPPSAAVAQIEQLLKAQFAQSQQKIDELLKSQRPDGKADKSGAAGRSQLLDLLMSNLAKGDSSSSDSPPPSPRDRNKANGQGDDSHGKNNQDDGNLKERSGLRPPPRERDDKKSAAPQPTAKQDSQDKKEDKKENQPQPAAGAAGPKDKGDEDDFSSLKPKSKAADSNSKANAAAPAEEMGDTPSGPGYSSQGAPASRGRVSQLPQIGGRGGGGGDFGGFGGFGGGGGGGGGGGSAKSGGGNPGPMFGGDPFQSVGQERQGGGGRGGEQGASPQMKPVGYAPAGSGDLTDDLEPTIGDESPVREVRKFPVEQILVMSDSKDSRRWILDQMGALRRTICPGGDSQRVGICQSLAFRAKLRKLENIQAKPVLGGLETP